jgi:uncharacterized protein YybS (DUF2232 family)
LLVLGLSTLSLALLLGSFQSTIFLAEYGVMALVLAEAIRRQWSIEKTILASTALPSVASGAVLVLLISSIDFNLVALQQHFDEDLSQMLRQLWSEGGEPSDDALHTYVQGVFGAVVQLLPALFMLSTAVGALLNYSAARLLWRRLGGQPALPEMNFAQWKAPEVCVWVLIASGLGSFIPIPGLQIVGLNVLFLVSLVYLLQGLAVMVFFLNRASVPPILRSLAYILLVIQPLILLGVAAFGLFDLWTDFRRTGNKQEETP